jgi:hypothetical protein
MNQPGKKIGLWKPWKNKLRFPTVPTAPTAADYQDEKQPTKTKDDRLHKIPCGSNGVQIILLAN